MGNDLFAAMLRVLVHPSIYRSIPTFRTFVRYVQAPQPNEQNRTLYSVLFVRRVGVRFVLFNKPKMIDATDLAGADQPAFPSRP